MTRYAAPNGDHEWDAALQSVGRLDFDPTVLYELLMQETDPAVFPQRLAEARTAVEARQAILERALIATVASDASCRRTRSNPSHGQLSPLRAPRPSSRAHSAVPAKPRKHQSRPRPAIPVGILSPLSPARTVSAPRPHPLDPSKLFSPGDPYGADPPTDLRSFVRQLEDLRRGPAPDASQPPFHQWLPPPVLRPESLPPYSIPTLQSHTSQRHANTTTISQPPPLALMTLLQPLDTAIVNGRPLEHQPILNFKDHRGYLLKWTHPVEAIVTPTRSSGEVSLSVIPTTGGTAWPNAVGMALFTHLGFVGDEGHFYTITFRTPGAQDLSVEGIQVLRGAPLPPPPPPTASVAPSAVFSPRPALKAANQSVDRPPGAVTIVAHGRQAPEPRPATDLLAPQTLRRAVPAPVRPPPLPTSTSFEDGIRHLWRRRGRVKTNRLGVEVFKGHPSHSIMQAMKEAIVTSVRYIHTLPVRPLTAAADFGSSTIRRKYRKSNFPKLGGAAVAVFEASARHPRPSAHHRFHFCDYNPTVFRSIREVFGVDAGAYARSLSDVWTTVKTPGKSRALLYFAGTQFVIKTLTKPESQFLRSILYGYYRHVQANPNTLVTRFYGHHCLTSVANRKRIRFVVMNNVFNTENYIHVKYDLKGSTFGRGASEREKQSGACILKDLDFAERKLLIGGARRALFLSQVKRDVEFLKRMGVMDYSMLVGIHEAEEPIAPHDAVTGASFGVDEGGMGSYTRPEIYYVGIIDVLQAFNIRKTAEYFVRSILHDKRTISAVPPAAYAARFLAFIEQHVQ